jgi:hypothetical protein
MEDPFDYIARVKAERSHRADSAILDELRAFAALPDDGDPEWKRDATWARAYDLVALSQLVAERHLVDGIGLVLDKMCLGEHDDMMMCGMRHAFEAAVDRDWSRLVAICVSRCTSERAGTRYWAADELGVLRDPSAMPTLLAMFEDRHADVALAAFRAASMMLYGHQRLRPRVIAALRAAGRERPVVRDAAQSCIEEIQRAAPAIFEIDRPTFEAELAAAICAYRDGSASEAYLAHAVYYLLRACLPDSVEWEGTRAVDGVQLASITLTSPETVELEGQVLWLGATPRSADRMDPLRAELTVDAAGTGLARAAMYVGDAEAGFSADEHQSIDPAAVTAWMLVLRK